MTFLKKLLLTFFALSISLIAISQQKFVWNAGYDFTADNREYMSGYGFPQTILNSRAMCQVGFAIDSSQKVMIGGSYLIVHGNEEFVGKPEMFLHYTVEKENYKVEIGAFPYGKQVFPLIMYTDSLLYENSNLEGLRANYHNKYFSQTVIVDWLTQVGAGEEEKFLAGIYGNAKASIFYLEDYMYYVHHAKERENQGKLIKDNFAYGVYAGIDLSQKLPIDSFCVDAGYVGTMYAVRGVETKNSGGLQIRAKLHYAAFGVEFSKYIGDAVYTPLGDPLYQCGNYSRLDLFFAPNFSHGKSIFSKQSDSRVNVMYKHGLHFLDGEFDNSQQVFVKVRLGN